MNEGVKPPARSILHSAWMHFPLSQILPSFLPPLVFVLNIHLLVRLRRRQRAAQAITLSFSCHTHSDTQPQHVQRKQTHLKSVHKRGKETQALCIRHKDYTLIPVHTARCSDTAASSPAAPRSSRISRNGLWGYRWRCNRTALTTLCISQLIT